MSSHPFVSVCIPVYNQSELLRENIRTILFYPGDDIEVIVSDNASEEDIEAVVASFHDSRLRYVRMPENKGLDMNILNAIRHSLGDYILLLRTKDLIYPHKMSAALDYMRKYPDAGYFFFSINDDLDIKDYYQAEKTYHKGREAYVANDAFLVHPSCQIYKRELLDCDLYERQINATIKNRMGFVAHSLIRMHLAAQADFRSSETVLYRFTENTARTPVSQNAEGSKKSFYTPEMQYPRYRVAFDFVKKVVAPEDRVFVWRLLMMRWYKWIVYDYKYLNQDKETHRHFGTEPEDFDPKQERKRFCEITRGMFDGLAPDEKKQLEKSLKLDTAVICLTPAYGTVSYKALRSIGRIVIWGRVMMGQRRLMERTGIEKK